MGRSLTNMGYGFIVYGNTPEGALFRKKTAEDVLLEELRKNDEQREFEREQELVDLTKEMPTCDGTK